MTIGPSESDSASESATESEPEAVTKSRGRVRRRRRRVRGPGPAAAAAAGGCWDRGSVPQESLSQTVPVAGFGCWPRRRTLSRSDTVSEASTCTVGRGCGAGPTVVSPDPVLLRLPQAHDDPSASTANYVGMPGPAALARSVPLTRSTVRLTSARLEIL